MKYQDAVERARKHARDTGKTIYVVYDPTCYDKNLTDYHYFPATKEQLEGFFGGRLPIWSSDNDRVENEENISS